MKYITIDGGTTNTRISLISDSVICDTIKLSVGARDSINTSNILKDKIRDGISEILSRNNLRNYDIERILASGMITSEFGLYELGHICVPAGINELHNSMKEICIREVSDIPFVMIPGVKSVSDDLQKTDMMRGEETELMGIMEENIGESIVLLPGSHSKIITTDKSGRINKITTQLTGEMIAVLTTQTILKDAVDLSVEPADEFILQGYAYCKEHGINEALFKVRVLKNLLDRTKQEIYGFFMGAVLCGEVQQVIKSSIKNVIISGKKQLKEASAVLLKAVSNKKVICVSDENSENATACGMIRIFEFSIKGD